MEINNRIKQSAKEADPELIRIRRTLHQYPEIARNEYQTSKIIAEELKKIPGIEVFEGLAEGTGVMGVLRGGKPGKCVVLRADIDALPVEETLDLPFKSKNPGYMHACGHDAHATWILGAARILSSMAEEVPGTVKFIFQPGEERGFGAREMIENDKVLENPKVDCAFAAHAWPTIESGKIGIAQKYAFGSGGGFQIKIIGKGGHGSWPYLAVNPILIASQICTMFPQILSDKVNSVHSRVISVCAIHAGKEGVGNVIPDECTICGTIRGTQEEAMKIMTTEIERIVKYCCELYGAKYECHCGYHMGGVANNPEMVTVVKQSASDIVGAENTYIIEEDNLGGENFAEFSSRVPSTYMFVGIKNEKLSAEPFALHSPKFMLDESVLAKAAGVFAKIVFEVNNK